MDKRCDGTEDCIDSSDEKDCETIKTFEGYNKNLLPPPRKNENIFPLNVSISISNIYTIDEINGKIKMKWTILRTWYNPQLKYMNLKRSESLNLLSQNEKKKIWIPYTNFHNRKESRRTDRKDTVMISSNINFNFKGSSKVEIMKYREFSGSENALKYERELDTTWSCDFHVAWYPFDKQICYLQFYQNEDNIALEPLAIHYAGPKELSLHNVELVKICHQRFFGKPGFAVEIHLHRPLVGSILTIFLPSIILVIISQVIQVYQVDHIDMVIGAQLTILLVLATM